MATELVRLSITNRPAVIVRVTSQGSHRRGTWVSLIPGVLRYNSGSFEVTEQGENMFLYGLDTNDRSRRLMMGLHRVDSPLQRTADRSFGGAVRMSVRCTFTAFQARGCDTVFEMMGARSGGGRAYPDCFTDDRTAKDAAECIRWEVIRQ